MTIIVYDQKALITDSLAVNDFGDSGRMSFHAAKIHFNADRTVALAYCGLAHPDYLNKWFLIHAEMQLMLNALLELKREHPLADNIGKTIGLFQDIMKHVPFPADELIDGIAISRRHAIRINKPGYSDISESRMSGAGCYVDAYWLMRQAGWTVAKTMQKISNTSALVGGDVQMQLQDNLRYADLADYIYQLQASGKYKNIVFSDLQLRAHKNQKTKKADK